MRHATHTPGPWYYHRTKHDGFTGPSVQSQYGLIVSMPTPEDQEGRANACLIAAAPEMLQVLRDELTALKEWKSAHPIHPDVREGIAISISKVEQAIHKATGR